MKTFSEYINEGGGTKSKAKVISLNGDYDKKDKYYKFLTELIGRYGEVIERDVNSVLLKFPNWMIKSFDNIGDAGNTWRFSIKNINFK